MLNPWAEEYLKSLLPNILSREDEPGADDLDLEKIRGPDARAKHALAVKFCC